MAAAPTTQRIFLNQFLTLGIYFLVWCYRLGSELNTALQRKAVPTLRWFIVPGGGLYWIWQMAAALETATGKRIRQTEIFLWYLLLSGAGGFGSVFYAPDLLTGHTAHSGDPVDISVKTMLIIAAIVIAILIIASLVLHATFMAIVQNKLNRVRGV